jgi:hypothetical protein
MGKANLQTLDGRAGMARGEAGGRSDSCFAAQSTIGIADRNNASEAYAGRFFTRGQGRYDRLVF